MKPDLILQWCVYCDYPLYRAWIKKYRERFNKIIIYPSRHHGYIDLEEFAKRVLPQTWVEPVSINYGYQDWRQAETEPCLQHIESDWLWFSEQDFFVRNWDKFFEDMERARRTSDVIGLWNPTHFPYVHPCCLWMKREVFEKTSKDFRAHPEINGADHFSMLTRDAEKLKAKITSLQDLGYSCDVTPGADAFHLGGLTYVYQDWKGGTKEDHIGAKSPEAFLSYNYWMRKANVEQNYSFMRLSREIQSHFMGSDTNLEIWKEFFNL